MTSVNVSSKPPFFRPFAEAAPGQQDRASVEGHVAGSCPSALDMAQPEVAEKKGNPSWEREPDNRNYLHPTEGFPHEGLRARPGQEQKPAMSYIALIANAILTSPNKKLNLGSIYKYIEDTFPYYKGRGQGWRNSVRHNLSLNECFIKAGRCEDGKGNYWSIHPSNLDDFSKGDFRQRRRCRRRGRAKELPVIYPSCPFPVEPLALNSLYSPYTEQERRAYRLDEVLYRQYISNPFWRWYHSCRNPAGSGCDTGLNTGAQWQGLGENGPPPNFFKTLNN